MLILGAGHGHLPKACSQSCWDAPPMTSRSPWPRRNESEEPPPRGSEVERAGRRRSRWLRPDRPAVADAIPVPGDAVGLGPVVVAPDRVEVGRSRIVNAAHLVQHRQRWRGSPSDHHHTSRGSRTSRSSSAPVRWRHVGRATSSAKTLIGPGEPAGRIGRSTRTRPGGRRRPPANVASTSGSPGGEEAGLPLRWCSDLDSEPTTVGPSSMSPGSMCPHCASCPSNACSPYM